MDRKGATSFGRPGADDRSRTGDLHLGKVTLYQLSYVRGASQYTKGIPPLMIQSNRGLLCHDDWREDRPLQRL